MKTLRGLCLLLVLLSTASCGTDSQDLPGLDPALAGAIRIDRPADDEVVVTHAATLEVALREDLAPASLRARLNGRDVSAHVRVDGSRATGWVGGLAPGENTLAFEARAAGAPDRMTRTVVRFRFEPRAVEDIEGTPPISVPGLSGRVEVLIDPWGIRHIYTMEDNPDDILFAVGYVMGRDRLFQLDLFRKAAQGRLTELFGMALDPGVLARDVWMRTVMTTRGGERIEDALVRDLRDRSPESFALLTHYIRGVNAYIDDLKAGRNGAVMPQQYVLLDNLFLLLGGGPYEIEPLTEAQVLSVGRLQQYELSSTLSEELFRMEEWCRIVDAEGAGAVPAGTLEDLYRSAAPDPQVILPPGEIGAVPEEGRLPDETEMPRPTVLEGCGRFLPTLERTAAAAAAFPGLLAPAGEKPASNNWTIGAGHTADGFAIVANDPHLTLSNPSILYQVHTDSKTFSGGPFNLSGATFPGLPGLLLGQTDRVAWGGTVTGYDVTDIYMEEVSVEEDGTKTVLWRGTQVPVLTVPETFRVRGGEDVIVPIDVVPHHGPQVPDPDPLDGIEGIEATGMSFRWTGHEITREVEAFFKAATAQDVDDLFEAFAHFGTGAQNWNGADLEGNIGYFPHALIPLRNARARSTDTPPYLPQPGTGEAEWETETDGSPRAVPRDRIPQARNPAQGFVVTANHDITGTTSDNDPLDDELYLYHSVADGFRGGEAQERIEETPPGERTPEGTMIVQGSHRSRLAERFMPFLERALENEEAHAGIDADTRGRMSEASDRLQAWDYRCETGTPDAFTGEPAGPAEVESAVGASIFFAWLRALAGKALDDEAAASGARIGTDERIAGLLHLLEDEGRTDPGFTVRTAGPDGQSRLWDDLGTPETEDRDRIIVLALASALDDLAERFGTADQTRWLWGQLHTLTLRLEGVGEVISAFNLPATDIVTQFRDGPPRGYPRAGGLSTVDVGNHGLLGGLDFPTGSGPAMRMVVEMEPGVMRAWNVMPGGTNDVFPGADLFNPVDVNEAIHYGDQLPRWLRNGYRPQYIFYEDVTAVAVSRFTLTP